MLLEVFYRHEFKPAAVNDKEFFFDFMSFTDPGSSYQVDMTNFSVKPVRKSLFAESSKLNLGDFITDQVFYKSKDGTSIPMSIVRKKSTLPTLTYKLKNPAPLVLYAYGGFGESTLPVFSSENMVLMNNLGGIFCVANIRGGGEYGDKWHTDGNLDKK